MVTEREQYRKNYESVMDSSHDARILELAQDFRKVWEASATTHVDRKRLLGLLIEDVTLTRDGCLVRVDLRLRGGKTHTLPPVNLPKYGAGARRREASPDPCRTRCTIRGGAP